MEKHQNFQRRKDFLRLREEDERVLRDIHAVLGQDSRGFVEDFYNHLLSFPEMCNLIESDAVLERLKKLQSLYFQSLTAGTYDDVYGAERQRVGLIHARVGLTPGWYLGAYSHYLTELLPKLASRSDQKPHEFLERLRALIKVVFLDMGLAVDSYITQRDELIAELRDYGAAFEHLPYGTLVVTERLEVVFSNQAFAQLTGCSSHDLEGQPLDDLMDVNGLPELVIDALCDLRVTGQVRLRPHLLALSIPVTVSVSALEQDKERGRTRLLLTFEDMREKEQLAQDLLNAQEVANIGTWHTDFNGRFSLTPKASHLLGWPIDWPLSHDDLCNGFHPDDRDYASAQWRAGAKSGKFAFEVRTLPYQGEEGKFRWLDIQGRVEFDALGRPARGYGTVLDITERREAEQRMRHLAILDGLTGLPNRVRGMELVQCLLQQAESSGCQVLVLFADLNRFKEINDTHGHSIGDRVLAGVAQQSQLALGSDSVLARLGGDEFVVARMLAADEDPAAIARHVHSAFAHPVSLGGLRFKMSASIGAAVYPLHARSADDLIQCADTAMYRAKASGCGYVLYDDEMGRDLQRHIALGIRLETALAHSLLKLHYQPKVELATGRLLGIEALARWHDLEWGWVSPAEFIPVAEKRNLISSLGAWSLESAARQWAAWRDAGMCAEGAEQPPAIAVNVSVMQLIDDDFAERAQSILRTHGVPAHAIELEITESALMFDSDKALSVVSHLVKEGFTFSIDDFGTGYSSLARLHAFPVSRLKIDLSFVRDMFGAPGSRPVVTAVINLAKALGIRTVAEGVETLEQAHLLQVLGCDEAQGYLYGKPLPADDLERCWLRSRHHVVDDTFQG